MGKFEFTDKSFGLMSVDELFTSQEERDEAKLQKIYEIPISEIDDFEGHPFIVKDDEDMMALATSIEEYGVMTPATVRKKEDGRYEMLSGHRRKRACELVGIEKLRCEVVEMDRDDAIIFMVDSNLQRTKILPSEKARSYKMRLDAMKRHAGRPSLDNSSPVATDLLGQRSDDMLAMVVGEGKDNIRRYIRLNELIPGLLKYVDSKDIALRPAVELSYLSKENQEAVLNSIETNCATPSHAQAIRMRKLQETNALTDEQIEMIMKEDKPNQKERLVISRKVLELIPEELPISERERFIVAAVKSYLRACKEQDMDPIDCGRTYSTHEKSDDLER